jgi:DNA-directed RNA polymerase specialized sigma subunit, sigma24 homolog
MWYGSAVNFAKVITENEEVAEEIYSDAMMKIWFMGGKLAEIDNLKTFLFVMLKNASLNYLKKAKKTKLYQSKRSIPTTT